MTHVTILLLFMAQDHLILTSRYLGSKTMDIYIKHGSNSLSKKLLLECWVFIRTNIFKPMGGLHHTVFQLLQEVFESIHCIGGVAFPYFDLL